MRVGGEGLEDVATLLAGGCHDRTESGEVGRAFEGAKGSRDLHLDLHHPQSLFGEVVGEGNGEVIKEAQDVVLVLLQPLAGCVPAVVARFSNDGRERWKARPARTASQ